MGPCVWKRRPGSLEAIFSHEHREVNRNRTEKTKKILLDAAGMGKCPPTCKISVSGCSLPRRDLNIFYVV